MRIRPSPIELEALARELCEAEDSCLHTQHYWLGDVEGRPRPCDKHWAMARLLHGRVVVKRLARPGAGAFGVRVPESGADAVPFPFQEDAMKEVLRWLQGAGVGAAGAVYVYVQALAPGGEPGTLEAFLTGAALTVLVRAVGWLVGKLPARPE